MCISKATLIVHVAVLKKVVITRRQAYNDYILGTLMLYVILWLPCLSTLWFWQILWLALVSECELVGNHGGVISH